MAHLDMKVTYHLELTPEEFRIVGRALACILKPGDETRAASELNARVQELRLKQAQLTYERCKATADKSQQEELP
jgi:hypothetical protein